MRHGGAAWQGDMHGGGHGRAGMCGRWVCMAGGASGGGCLLLVLGMSAQTPPCGQTHMCKNITLAKLRSGR